MDFWAGVALLVVGVNVCSPFEMLQTTLDSLVIWIRVFKSIQIHRLILRLCQPMFSLEVWSGQFLEGPKVFVLGRHSQPWFVLMFVFLGVLEWMTQV